MKLREGIFMLRHSLRALCAVVLLLTPVAALAQALDIPDTLEVQEISESNALEKMRDCYSRISQDEFDRIRQRLTKNDATTQTSLTAPTERFALVEKRGLWMCVALSPSRYPILPVDTLSFAAKPTGADPARTKAFFQAVSRSLAETGFARALVPYASSGNASVIFFAVSAEQPGSLAVESRFMKKGEFNPEEYGIRIDDPAVTGLTTKRVGQDNSRVDIFVDKHPKRTIVGGYLIRVGNDRTRSFSFAGTTWKSPFALSTSVSFQKEGVLVYRSKTSTSFGSWKVSDGVLYFDINKYSYYSAVLDSRDYLETEGRRSASPSNRPGAESSLPTEQRFKTTYFQEGNAAAEKEAREKLESALKAFQILVDTRKNTVLGESGADEERLQSAGKKRQTLCEGELFGMAVMLAPERSTNPGELCMSYAGSRNEWKATILKEGCKGRCTVF